MRVIQEQAPSFFFKIFFIWINLKVFIESITILLLLYVLGFWLQGMWDFSFPTRDWTLTPYIGACRLNHWTAGEVPRLHLYWPLYSFPQLRNNSNRYLNTILTVYSTCCFCCLVPKSCPTLSNPMDCSPPGSAVHGISQARILEWVAISFSRGSLQPGIKPVSLASPALAGRVFTSSTSWEAPLPHIPLSPALSGGFLTTEPLYK